MQIVLKDYKDPDEDLAYEQGNINLTLYSDSLFTKLIKEHDIMSLICIFEPSNLKIKDTIPFENFFLLDLQKLKNSVVREASSTWYKTKAFSQGDKQKGKSQTFVERWQFYKRQKEHRPCNSLFAFRSSNRFSRHHCRFRSGKFCL